MVQAVENLTALTLRLLARAAHPRLDQWDLVTCQVLAALPVPGRADLVSPHITDARLSLGIRRELLVDVVLGATLHLRARLGSSGDILAEPYPAAGDFRVERP
ncbi:hypothetical protein [Streptomyces tanashiensis]|uniref:Uncharacterized protein n=1 Tax=Streptomyces tanashiensis TaxID=67367 RepID=A0ABY6QTM6_9ACTN|nr:hypothetical protein [Streptomyces tanashiensis]UZX20109.1 hypothetical protein LDH80_04975 [Streptomyces tanashiensis]GGY44486.1 hypothetical protein GCM10010299_58410 [Streptomyces tanashiensis]